MTKLNNFSETFFSKKKILLFIIIVYLITLVVYSNSFKGEFVFDDNLHFFEMNKLTGPQEFTSIPYWMNITNRPFAFFTFSLNYLIHETNVFGYRLVNFIIHLITGLMVFLFLRLILLTYYQKEKSSSKYSFFINLLPLASMLIFLVHPVQTSAVSYIIQRMASLAALFYISSVYFYLLGRLNHVKNGFDYRTFISYFIAFISFILGMLTKENSATIPLAMLLTEICFVRNGKGRPFTKYIVGVSLFLVTGFLALVLGGKLPVEPNLDYSRSDYLFTQFRVIVRYFALLIFPLNQNVDYDFALSQSFFDSGVIPSFLLVLGTLLVGLLVHKKNKLISFMIFWFYLCLAVESSIIPIRDVIFEHRLYLSMISFAFLVTYLFLDFSWRFLKIKHPVPKVVFFSFFMFLLVIPYGALTYRRNTVWQSGYALWSDTIRKSPDKARPNNNLGREYRKLGDFDKAVYYYKRAISLDPEYAMAYNNLGAVYHMKGDIEAALTNYHAAIYHDSGNVDALTNLGIIYQSMNNLERAKEFFNRAYQEKPYDTGVLYNLAVSEHLSDNLNQAQRHYNRILELNPNHFNALYYNGMIFMMQNKFSEALDLFLRALRVRPNEERVLRYIVHVYEIKGDYDKAEYYKNYVNNPR